MAPLDVGLVPRRLGLNRLARLEPRLPVIRYERERPGEMIRLNIKKLGQIKGIGHRFAPRGAGTHPVLLCYFKAMARRWPSPTLPASSTLHGLLFKTNELGKAEESNSDDSVPPVAIGYRLCRPRLGDRHREGALLTHSESGETPAR